MEQNVELIGKAIAKVLELHKGVRKGDEKTPEAVHALEVGIIVARYTNSLELIAGALLHDSVEKGGYSLEAVEVEFSPLVKGYLASLTEDKSIADWDSRKAENLRRLQENQDALFIKSADAMANMRSLVVAIRAEGPKVWKRFNAPKEKKMLQFKTILAMAEQIMPKLMLQDYVAILKDLEYAEKSADSSLGF